MRLLALSIFSLSLFSVDIAPDNPNRRPAPSSPGCSSKRNLVTLTATPPMEMRTRI